MLLCVGMFFIIYKFIQIFNTMETPTYLTKEGFEKLKNKLNKLIHEERPQIAQMIAEAREKGDITENAEYDAAKDAQSKLENEISQLQLLLANVKIIEEDEIDKSQVRILTVVTIKNLSNNQIISYKLVPDKEADLKQKHLGINSPVAQALLGKKIDDIVEINVPAGIINYKILKIE
jgi:transcription elongation factor GreA